MSPNGVPVPGTPELSIVEPADRSETGRRRRAARRRRTVRDLLAFGPGLAPPLSSGDGLPGGLRSRARRVAFEPRARIDHRSAPPPDVTRSGAIVRASGEAIGYSCGRLTGIQRRADESESFGSDCAGCGAP